MILKSFAKVNLGLQIENKRNDGFHNLKMIVVFLSLYDTIEISQLDEKKIIVSCDKNVCAQEENLAYKSAKKFFEYFKSNRGIKIHIQKKIPDRAGLGGGSSNASCVLYAMNKIFNSNFSVETMKSISSEISSDSPMFFSSGIVECAGKGEIINTFRDKCIENCKFLIKTGNIKVSTKNAYLLFDKINLYNNDDNRIENLKKSINSSNYNKISDNCFNDFEKITNVPRGWHLTGSGSASFKIVDRSFENINKEIIECFQVKNGIQII